MKCPRCGNGRIKYLHRKKDFYTNKKKQRDKMVRTDDIAKCEVCGFEGEV